MQKLPSCGNFHIPDMNCSILYHPTLTTTTTTIPKRVNFITALRRHHRRNLLKKPLPSTITNIPSTTTYSPSSSSPSNQTLQLQINLQPPDSLNALLNTSKLYLNHFIESSQYAFDDLKTLVKVEHNNPNKVVISCKRSTVEFLGTTLVASLVFYYALRAILKLGKVLFSFRRNNTGGEEMLYKRDRSMGGKLVAVGRKGETTSLDYVESKEKIETRESFWDRGWRRRKEDRMPKWWPPPGSNSGALVDDGDDKEEYQKMANRFMRAMMDNRLRGKDISEDDIYQLRRLCKTYGVRVSVETANSRDSFYRTSINYVLNRCENMGIEAASIEFEGENVQQFIAGLADNIGLPQSRAAKMVSAAVAARTRSRFLQAWALEMQGKHSEAVIELSKLCIIHQIFPPDERSPEMEMVARGLENHLKVDQRESLMNTLTGVCGDQTPTSVVEALGLVR